MGCRGADQAQWRAFGEESEETYRLQISGYYLAGNLNHVAGVYFDIRLVLINYTTKYLSMARVLQ